MVVVQVHFERRATWRRHKKSQSTRARHELKRAATRSSLLTRHDAATAASARSVSSTRTASTVAGWCSSWLCAFECVDSVNDLRDDAFTWCAPRITHTPRPCRLAQLALILLRALKACLPPPLLKQLCCSELISTRRRRRARRRGARVADGARRAWIQRRWPARRQSACRRSEVATTARHRGGRRRRAAQRGAVACVRHYRASRHERGRYDRAAFCRRRLRRAPLCRGESARANARVGVWGRSPEQSSSG